MIDAFLELIARGSFRGFLKSLFCDEPCNDPTWMYPVVFLSIFIAIVVALLLRSRKRKAARK